MSVSKRKKIISTEPTLRRRGGIRYFLGGCDPKFSRRSALFAAASLLLGGWKYVLNQAPSASSAAVKPIKTASAITRRDFLKASAPEAPEAPPPSAEPTNENPSTSAVSEKLGKEIETLQPYEEARISLDEKAVIAGILVGEAGGEGLRGMQAVMNVIQNRAGWNQDCFYQAAIQYRQFSAANDVTDAYGAGNTAPVEAFTAKTGILVQHPQYKNALLLTELACRGTLPDITDGADHYYSLLVFKNGKKPYWHKDIYEKSWQQIGNHMFGDSAKVYRSHSDEIEKRRTHAEEHSEVFLLESGLAFHDIVKTVGLKH